MTVELALDADRAHGAASIQAAIDALPPDGGRIVLPAGEIVLDRGIALRSGVELVGQGTNTVLIKAPGRIYPFSGYHNYRMPDVPLEHADGLEPGMTVAIRDDTHGGFFETFARITWVDGTWVGIDRGLDSDYYADQHPMLVTAFPLVYGLGIAHAALRNLRLDGNRSAQPTGIGACRGAAVYFYQSHGFAVTGVSESGFLGEGLGFQMCSHVHIADCLFQSNAGNGFHPGAGSTGVLFERCTATNNERAGFFFCVRANHITVRDCVFQHNVDCGVSIGTRDCYNRIERSAILSNRGPGILFRQGPRPVEVHSVRVADCDIRENARHSGRGQIHVQGDAHDLAFVGNRFASCVDVSRPDVYMSPGCTRVWLADNKAGDCVPAIIAQPESLAVDAPRFSCGRDDARPEDYRHLDVPEGFCE